jgi:hypothetical protein
MLLEVSKDEASSLPSKMIDDMSTIFLLYTITMSAFLYMLVYTNISTSGL